MNAANKLYAGGLVFCVCFLLACYRAPIAQRTLAPVLDYGQISYEALGDLAGSVIVVDPHYGRVLKRIAHSMDVQYTTSPFEIAQVITAYAALDSGAITAKTKFPCGSNTADQVGVSEALSRPCAGFFSEISKKVPPANFKKAAQTIGFTYYGKENISNTATAMKPISATIPLNIGGADYQALAVRGLGMRANDLHFAQLAISLAAGTSTSERMSTTILNSAQGITPPTIPLNAQAISVIREGLTKAVENGSASAAGFGNNSIAATLGSNDESAMCISFAPANNPQIGLVVFLKEGTPAEAAQVTGKFYKNYFGK
jgi:penicillin-binding protein 2